MNPEIKEKWITALKSGEYPKGRTALKTDVGYCCLGVLCEVYANTVNDGSKFLYDPESGTYEFTIGDTTKGRSGFLPLTVAEWAGIKDHLSFNVIDAQGRLANINDNADTFEPVIDLIESIL